MFRNQRFNVFIFLLLFALLYYSSVVLVGIASPGGKWYSSFLDRYANIPSWLTYFICTSAKTLLELLGYDVYQKAPDNIGIRGSTGVTIIWACLGFGVMSFWIAFVAAHHAGWKYKIKWMIAGIVFVIVLNIFRITSIPLAYHYNWQFYKSIDPHLLFNIVSYGFIIGLAAVFVYRYNRRRKQNGEKRGE